jgi:hypothetical protein
MLRTKLVRILGLCLLLFALVYWRYGIRIAAVVFACFVCGYVNEFYVIRSAVSLLRRTAVGSKAALAAACAVVADLCIIYYGVSVPLAMATAMFFVIDAAVLRFR